MGLPGCPLTRGLAAPDRRRVHRRTAGRAHLLSSAMARILLIEDNDALRTMLAEVLALAGHTVVEAGNGREGLDLFRQGGADLVITDLVMPEIEGLEVISRQPGCWARRGCSTNRLRPRCCSRRLTSCCRATARAPATQRLDRAGHSMGPPPARPACRHASDVLSVSHRDRQTAVSMSNHRDPSAQEQDLERAAQDLGRRVVRSARPLAIAVRAAARVWRRRFSSWGSCAAQ
jgi:hypothetical protein